MLVLRGGGGKMIRTVKTNLGNMIKKVAICKANANCIGFMYEPRKPKNLEKVNTQRKGN
jgi:cyclic lactone autoinducer peptide